MQSTAVVPLGPSVKTTTQRSSYHHVHVSSGVFRCVWSCAALLHVVCGFYYFGVAYGYWVTTPATALARTLRFYKLGIDTTSYRTVAITHGAIGVVHTALLGVMVMCSIYRRRCSFSSAQQDGNTNVSREESYLKAAKSKAGERLCWKRFVRRVHAVRRVVDAIFGRKGILGVEGPYFDVHLLCLEVVETVLQSYQAYRMSQHIARPWLNHLIVSLIVVNCVCTPVLQCVFGKNSLAQRATCLAIDAVLDLVSSVVVPASLLSLYSVAYTGTSGGFNGDLWFSDTWFVNASNEFQLMLVDSWGDLATRLVVAVGFIASLESAKSLVRVRAKSTAQTPRRPGNNTNAWTESKAPAPILKSLPRRSMLGNARGWLGKSARGRLVKRLVHAALAAWGITILAIHLHAASLPRAPVCAMQLRPWLEAKPACALMVIDCYASDTIRAPYVVSDPNRVVRLIIRHCPTLRIPSPLQTLRAMTLIKIYNSTIIDWPSEAALTGTHHPVLKTVSMVRVVFPDGQLPPGLVDGGFPQHATSMLFCGTNLRGLPQELATRWPHYAFFLFEHSQFHTFPSVLSALHPIQISFAENLFTEFPFEALTIPSLVYFNMGGNRAISSLLPPNGTIASQSLAFVNVVNTNVSVMPDWFDARLRLTVHPTVPQIYPIVAASGTPLCENTAKVIAGVFPAFPGLASIPPARRSFMMNYTHADAAALQSMSLCWPIATLFYPLGWEDDSNQA